jgi:S-DNA-T family DNA segregation ATPase FtsK/SpoIIIE
MYGELASEMIHCPNCREDVPKTLYCLNCGYPLYKIEREEKTLPIEEAEPEILETVPEEVEVSTSIEVEELPETITEEVIEEKIETTIEVEEVEIQELPEEAEEVEIQELPEEAEEVEIQELPEEVEIETEIEEPLEVVVEVEIEESEGIVDEELEIEPVVTEPVESVEEIQEEPEVPSPEIISEEPVPVSPVEPPVEVKIDFTPDPLTQEVMENLAKNITLKIRLIRLLQEEQVKEETFKKLFDTYVDQGRIWVSRKDEILRRFKSDIERMEENLVTARKDFELLEIRKSIGDADEKEYDVKAPAYKWDIENLEKEIQNRKAGVIYVSNLNKMVPSEEIEELKIMSDSDYVSLDEIETVSEDTISKMKETLKEAHNTLNN